MSDLRPIEITDFSGGIDQTEKPGINTVYDMCNFVPTRDGLKLRPGFVDKTLNTSIKWPSLLAEYRSDPKYDSSYYDTLIVVGSSTGQTDECDQWIETRQPLSGQSTALSTTYIADSLPLAYDRLKAVQGLYRTTDNAGDTRYLLALAITNPEQTPVLYHQDGGSGNLIFMEAVDGGHSGISYLTETPSSKYFIRFKERLFALNIQKAGNRVYHTGPDSAGAFPMNVWPVTYNFDIGDGEDITGALVFQDRLIVFTKAKTYAVSGDGVSGIWQVDCIDDIHGALPGQFFCSTGNAYFFGNYGGIFLGQGGLAQNISHPKLENTWKNIGLSQSNWEPYAFYDQDNKRVLFFVTLGHDYDTVSGDDFYDDCVLCFDLVLNAWSRWGAWGTSFDEHPPTGTNYVTFPRVILQPQMFEPSLTVALMAANTRVYVMQEDAPFDNGGQANSPYPIHAFLKTHEYMKEDPFLKIVSRVTVTSQQTGDQDLLALVIKDGADLLTAYKGGWRHWIISDAADAAEHPVHTARKVGTTDYLPAGTLVDIYDMETLYKLGDYTVATNPTGDNYVKLTTSHDPASNKWNVIIEDGIFRGRLLDLNPGDASIANNSACKWSGAPAGDTTSGSCASTNDEKLIAGYAGVKGRFFSLYITNVGSYQDDTNQEFAKCIPVRITGVGMWIRPLGVLSP